MKREIHIGTVVPGENGEKSPLEAADEKPGETILRVRRALGGIEERADRAVQP